MRVPAAEAHSAGTDGNRESGMSLPFPYFTNTIFFTALKEFVWIL